MREVEERRGAREEEEDEVGCAGAEEEVQVRAGEEGAGGGEVSAGGVGVEDAGAAVRGRGARGEGVAGAGERCGETGAGREGSEGGWCCGEA